MYYQKTFRRKQKFRKRENTWKIDLEDKLGNKSWLIRWKNPPSDSLKYTQFFATFEAFTAVEIQVEICGLGQIFHWNLSHKLQAKVEIVEWLNVCINTREHNCFKMLSSHRPILSHLSTMACLNVFSFYKENVRNLNGLIFVVFWTRRPSLLKAKVFCSSWIQSVSSWAIFIKCILVFSHIPL